MKQCASCGKRYDMAQTTCPSCWTRGWVAAPESGEAAEVPVNPNPCAECGYMASAGVARCPNCKAKLRPRALEWICLLGLIGCPAAALSMLLATINERTLWHLPDILWCSVTALVCWGLLRGHYRALQGMLAVLIAAPVLLIGQIVIAESQDNVFLASDFATMLLFRFFGVLLLWVFFRNAAIQDFCAFGKPKEVYETQAVFLEQTRATKTQRAGSSITRNL